MEVDTEAMVLARNWGAIAVRGVAAILFALLTFAVPGLTLAALVLLFGAYALIDGIWHFDCAAPTRSCATYPSDARRRYQRPKVLARCRALRRHR
jgi:uncharacterized membrane protein HdeD (DUF308 family)